MSSSPSSEEPKVQNAGSLSTGRRRSPPPRPTQPQRQDNNRADAEFDLPEGSHPLPTPAAGSPSSEKRRAPAERRPQPRYEDSNRPHGEDDLPQRSAPAVGRPAPEKRRLPPARQAQPRDEDMRRPRGKNDLPQHPRPIARNPDSARRRAPLARPAQQRDMDNSKLHGEVDFIEGSLPRPLPRKSNPLQSRAAAALTSQIRPNGQGAASSHPGVGKCDGKNCEWRQFYNRAKRGLDLNEKELAATQDMLHKSRAEITKLKTMLSHPKRRAQAAEKQGARQTKFSEDGQRRQEKGEAVNRKREHELEAKPGEGGHRLAMKELRTDEERAAEREAEPRKADLAAKSAATAEGLAPEAQRTHGETQRARMPKEMQGQMAPRRPAERAGVMGNAPRPAATRRPAASTASPRALPRSPRDQDLA